MKHGVTKCEWCLTESSNTHMQCIKCGGPVAVLEPWVLQCGWCSSSNRRDLTTDCKSCGGELPHIPGTPRQPEPPKAPRKLVSRYENKVRYWKNTHFLFGAISMIFILPGLCFWPFLLFPLIGFFVLRYGKKQAENKLAALKFGVPTRGIIKKVFVDTSQHINNFHPVRINYVFDTPEGQHESFVITWDDSNLNRPQGEHIWAVVVPKNPTQSNLWPPL